MQHLFGTAAIGWGEWGLILAFGVALFVVVEVEKAVFRRGRREVQ